MFGKISDTFCMKFFIHQKLYINAKYILLRYVCCLSALFMSDNAGKFKESNLHAEPLFRFTQIFTHRNLRKDMRKTSLRRLSFLLTIFLDIFWDFFVVVIVVIIICKKKTRLNPLFPLGHMNKTYNNSPRQPSQRQVSVYQHHLRPLHQRYQ